MARHKIPQSVTIMGMEYKLELVDELKDENGDELWGLTDSGKYVITIVDGPRKRVNRVLCHEIIHVWQDALGIKVSEDQAVKFEAPLFDLFMNSPELVAFLQRKAW
jgi:uncharacterized Zn finger protein